MFQGYHYQNRTHAMQVLNKRVSLPEARLGIGEAENLKALPNIVQYPTIQKMPVIPDLSKSSIEAATIDGQGQIFSEKDFPKSNYIGEMIGGI